MASSRWKRFAFFERHTLSLHSEVLGDLISSSGGSSEHIRSLRSPEAEATTFNDHVNLVVTTAALPLGTKPQVLPSLTDEKKQQEGDGGEDALEAMWSSLTACTNPQLLADSDKDPSTSSPNVHLPSQIQLSRKQEGAATGSSLETSSAAMDGLVLAFVTSRDTELVHCFDVTVRCNGPSLGGDDANAESKDHLEDYDGWRGYFAPFVGQGARPGTSQEENIISSHMQDSNERVVGIAACRSTTGYRALFVACIARHRLVVYQDPHVHLSCRRPLTSPKPAADAKIYSLASATPWNESSDGDCQVVDIAPGLVAVGSSKGSVLVYTYDQSGNNTALKRHLRIPPPPSGGLEVISVRTFLDETKASIFVAYRRSTSPASSSPAPQMSSAAGIFCYDMPLPGHSASAISAPSARHDLDGRYVGSSSLVDAASSNGGVQVTVARPDGLYSYSRTERVGVAPIDGTKLAICLIPPPVRMDIAHEVEDVAAGYALVASTDSKSGRDAVDIYDSVNKLVAFHLLLSPGHRAVRAAGVTTPPAFTSGGIAKNGRSSAVVLTSGGSLVTLTEKSTEEKISLLVQKNLYSAAIVVAYADPSYEPASITTLYRRYAEHLYRKGDFSGAIDKYMYTIGSLESSHVIFRFLDAPKIPLLVKYLEKLRSKELATPVHNELLRTCYLKLNDTEAAEAIAASSSSSIDKASLTSILSNLKSSPKEALAIICSLDAEQAAEVVMIHGASLARVLPREMAGIVIALCVGTYSSKALAEASLLDARSMSKMIEYATDDRPRSCEPYPVDLFAFAFIEHPKMLRLILAHCNRNKCHLTPSLRRTLLELTLAEWNQAIRSGDTEAEKLRHKEAIAALTDSHCRDIGDYDALVIVQQANFEEGELLLYERLQMAPMLMSRYAAEGGEKARRQMLAMCQSDPEILADVLGHFVTIASEKLTELDKNKNRPGDDSDDDEAEEILEDIQEVLSLARRQGVLPPVRIARILAGEGTGQFSRDSAKNKVQKQRTVPLSVALEYVGTILEESRQEISRLKSEVEEYNQLCNSMESEIDRLWRATQGLPPVADDSAAEKNSRFNIDELYSKVRAEEGTVEKTPQEQPREAFWRDMNQSEDSFDTIARFFARGVIK